MYIGDKINQLRKEQHISLVELSSMSGVQVATISRIENKKMVGTLESHMKIAKALSVDVTDLYQDITEHTEPAIQPQEPVEVFTHQDSSSIELLTKDALRKKMLPTIIHLKPKATTQTEQYKLSTERFIYGLKGSCQISINNKSYTLKQGTSMYFNAALPHQFHNTSKEHIAILCVTTPAVL